MELLFTAGIFFIGFLALLLAGFNALLEAKIDPIKKDIGHLESRLDKMEGRLDKVEERLDKLESKLDQILNIIKEYRAT